MQRNNLKIISCINNVFNYSNSRFCVLCLFMSIKQKMLFFLTDIYIIIYHVMPSVIEPLLVPQRA